MNAKHSCVFGLWWLVSIQSFGIATAMAQPPMGGDGPVLSAAAAAHFDVGILQASQGNWESAALAFERAHALAPDPSVLYNLGLTYLAMGARAKAANALERYRLDAGPAVSKERRSWVEAQLRELAASLGRVELTWQPPKAAAILDDAALNDQTLYVSPGQHTFSLSHSGYATETRVLEVSAGATYRANFGLRPLPSIEIDCPIPDVNVLAEGRWVHSTDGVVPVLIRPALLPLRILLLREGYLSQSINVSDGVSPIKLRCGLLPQRTNAGVTFISDGPTRVWVDGEQVESTLTVPPGRHLLTKVERDGRRRRWYENTNDRQVVNLSDASSSTALEKSAAGSVTPLWLIGTGVALSVAAAGILYYNTLRNEQWIDAGRHPEEAESLRRSIQSSDRLAYAGLGGGVMFTGVGLALMFGAD